VLPESDEGTESVHLTLCGDKYASSTLCSIPTRTVNNWGHCWNEFEVVVARVKCIVSIRQRSKQEGNEVKAHDLGKPTTLLLWIFVLGDDDQRGVDAVQHH
jgi:hypothetical protein